MPRRIHHAVYLFPANELPAAVTFWENALGVTMEEVPYRPGLSIFHSPDAGIELVAPVPGADGVPAAMTRFLESRGAGLYTLVFQVDDLEESIDRADRLNVKAKRRLEFPVGTQVEMAEHHGMRVTLRQDKPGGAEDD